MTRKDDATFVLKWGGMVIWRTKRLPVLLAVMPLLTAANEQRGLSRWGRFLFWPLKDI